TAAAAADPRPCRARRDERWWPAGARSPAARPRGWPPAPTARRARARARRTSSRPEHNAGAHAARGTWTTCQTRTVYAGAYDPRNDRPDLGVRRDEAERSHARHP